MHGFSWLVGGWTNPKDSVWEDFLEPFWEDEGIWPKIYNELVEFVPTPLKKYAQVKMEKSSPNFAGWNFQTYLRIERMHLDWRCTSPENERMSPENPWSVQMYFLLK